MDGLKEGDVREALERILCGMSYPAEQARIVQLLVERIDVSPDSSPWYGLPDIPTTAEAGLPNFVSQTFFGVFAAAKRSTR